MIVAHIITTWFSTIILALTSKERWGAAGKFNNTMANKWFLVIGGIILAILVMLFLIATYKQRRKRAKHI